MADKRISQLVDRGTVLNNDVVPIVAFGATTTNKATISSIQTFMQGNLDLGVTSVGITLGSSGTDVNVTGSPITTSGNITINIPTATATNRGLLSAADWSTFNSKAPAGNYVTTDTNQSITGFKSFVNGFSLASEGGTNHPSTFINTGSIHEGSAGSNIFGFNNSNNIYFGKGLSNGGVIQWNNSAVRYYTLPNADGTIALASDLTGFVTLNTAQTITAQKTFTTSGSSDTMIISHGSGSGIALDVIKAGNGQAIRVQKTSGSGDAVTITGDASITGAFSVTNSTSTFAVMNSTNANGGVLTFRRNGTNVGHIGNSAQLGGGVLDAIEVRSGVGSSVILRSDGGQLTLATGGAATLTGALNGTSAVFSGSVTAAGNIYTTNDSVFNTAGSITRHATVGLVLRGASAAVFDLALYSANGTAMMTNPAGSTNLNFNVGCNVGMGGTLNVTGAATFSSSVTALEFLSTFSGNGFNANFNKTGGFGGCIQLQNTSALSSDLIRVLDSANNIISRIEPATGGINFAQGNVGIGTATPFSQGTSPTSLEIAGSNFGQLFVSANSGTARGTLMARSATSDVYIGAITNSPLAFGTNDTERMRITSGGSVCVGVTSAANSQGLFVYRSNFASAFQTDAGTGQEAVRFLNGSNAVGTITTTAVATSYNMTSDYRLKEDLQEIKGLEKVQAMKVYDYKWKSEDSRMDGVLAHELAEVLPYAVTGEKDELNEDGTDKMQGVDYSKIVPILIKAIQEQQEQIDSLKNQMQ